MESSLVAKAKTAWQAAAAKAERVITEIKADLKVDLVKPGHTGVTQLFRGNDGKGDLPWVGKSEHEKRLEPELRKRILDISKKPEEHMFQAYDDGSSMDMRAAMQSAGAVLEFDEELRNLRFLYVPKRMKEQEFWRRYFAAVKCIKQEILDIDSDVITDGPVLSVDQRSCSDVSSIEGESPRKDPTEEEAYKKAFSVVAIPPSMVVRRLAAAIAVGRSVKSMKDLAIGSRTLERDSLSHSGDWTGLVSGLAAMRKLSHKEKRSKSLNSASSDGFHASLWSLFESDA